MVECDQVGGEKASACPAHGEGKVECSTQEEESVGRVNKIVRDMHHGQQQAAAAAALFQPGWA